MSEFELLARPTITTDDGARLAVFLYGPEGALEPAQGESELSAPSLAHLSELPIVMLHGNGESHENMARLIEMVAPERVVIAIDSRGHGESVRGSEPLSYERMAADVVQVLATLEASMVHVFGFSDGGIVSLLLALAEPERIASMTIMGTNLSPAGLNQDFLDAVADDLAQLEQESLPAQSQEDTTRYPQADLLRLMLEQPHISPFKLKKITCPVAVMCGTYDLIKLEESHAIAEALPNCSLTVVKGASHDLPNEAPEAVLHEAAVAIEEAEASL